MAAALLLSLADGDGFAGACPRMRTRATTTTRQRPAFAVPHNESDHELRANVPSDAAHPLHCLVCHWARAFDRSQPVGRNRADFRSRASHVQRAVVSPHARAASPPPAAQPPLRPPEVLRPSPSGRPGARRVSRQLTFGD